MGLLFDSWLTAKKLWSYHYQRNMEIKRKTPKLDKNLLEVENFRNSL